METIHLTPDAHADLITAAWRKRYPPSRIYRRGSQFTSGSSVTYFYIDGPPLKEAEAFVRQFRTRGFDATTNGPCTTTFEHDGKRYKGGYAFIDIRREYSDNFIGERMQELLREHNLASTQDLTPKGESVHWQAIRELEARDLRHVRSTRARAPVSFAQLRRTLTVGTCVRVTFLNSDGSELSTQGPCAILVQQSNAIAIESETGKMKRQWWYWGSAHHVHIHTPTQFTVAREDGTPIARFEILEKGSA